MNNQYRIKKRLGVTPRISETADVNDSQLGIYCEVGDRTVICESIIGDFSYIMHDCDIIYTHIGKFCSIANQVRLNPGQHPLEHAALHHFTYRSELFGMGEDHKVFFEDRRSRIVELGHDVWIGHGAVVMPGIRIGTGAVIGAGSVVTRDVADFTVVAGSPARTLRLRFPEDVQHALLSMKWWHWSKDELENALPDFRSMTAVEFVKKYR